MNHFSKLAVVALMACALAPGAALAQRAPASACSVLAGARWAGAMDGPFPTTTGAPARFSVLVDFRAGMNNAPVLVGVILVAPGSAAGGMSYTTTACENLAASSDGLRTAKISYSNSGWNTWTIAADGRTATVQGGEVNSGGVSGVFARLP